MAAAMYRKCSKNLLATSSKIGSTLVASSSEIFSMFRQYIAIQLVPSDCSRYPPHGKGLDRSKTPMLSSPRSDFSGQLQRNLQHVQAIHRHPAGAVGLFQIPAPRQGLGPVEDADVVQSQIGL